jgi:hypothetical protein
LLKQRACARGIERLCCAQLDAGVARTVASREGLSFFIHELPLDDRTPERNPSQVLDALLAGVKSVGNSHRLGPWPASTMCWRRASAAIARKASFGRNDLTLTKSTAGFLESIYRLATLFRTCRGNVPRPFEAIDEKTSNDETRANKRTLLNRFTPQPQLDIAG